MKYDLQILSEYQAILDQKICENHGLDSSVTIERRVLAFLVELGELANETRCFKYWSLKKASERDVILEEYVDGIHFLVSLGNQVECDFIYQIEESDEDLTSLFVKIFNGASNLQETFNQDKLNELFRQYLSLGYQLDFDNEAIISGYLLKNELNHKRQEEAY